ncbi:hypothetical protein [Streptomyces sp. 150FB]|uniref:hypothetical protein n=1 Tax=Streptomyces sp. 150FB TaxID=1576605 RepID=UPI000697D1B5|nr:hypothetical protein [Streptomyces sp. 150FB]
MSEDIVQARRVIGVEEHAWTPELRKALPKWGGDQTVNKLSSRGEVSRRLLDVGEERLARMDASGVDMEVLSITTPGTQPLPARAAIPLARKANDVLADAVRRHPDRSPPSPRYPCLTRGQPLPNWIAPSPGWDTSARCSSRARARGSWTTTASGLCSRPLPTSACRCTYTRPCRPGKSSTPPTAGLGGVDSRGSFAGPGGARAFVDTAPLDEQGRAKLGHLNAERILSLKTT